MFWQGAEIFQCIPSDVSVIQMFILKRQKRFDEPDAGFITQTAAPFEIRWTTSSFRKMIGASYSSAIEVLFESLDIGWIFWEVAIMSTYCFLKH